MMIYLDTETFIPQLPVEGIGKVEPGSSLGESENFPFGGKDADLVGVKIELDRIEEVHRVRSGILQDLADRFYPAIELGVFLHVFAFVLPMGGKSTLRYIVHAARAYLYFYPFSIGPHHGKVERLVAIGLGRTNPVADAVCLVAV